MNSPLCDLEGKDRVVLCCENELCYQLSVVDYASGSAGPRAGTDGLTWFGLRDKSRGFDYFTSESHMSQK